jgi:hypothetical protein
MAVVSRERLEHLAGLLPREEESLPRRKTAGIDLAAWLAEHGIAVRNTKPWQGGTLFVLADCPFSSAHHDGAFAIQFAGGAIFAGCHHAKVAAEGPSAGRNSGRCMRRRRRSRGGYLEIRRGEAGLPGSEETPPSDPSRARARAILREGDPLGFILDAFNKTHVGDRTVAESLAISVVSRSVENTNGLHVAISGNSGKGKTHACTTMLNLLPEASRLKGTVSDKALYYDDDLRPGTVFLFDDVTLSPDLQEVLKSATSNFREPIEHRTLTTERKLRVCTIPERCIWWLAKVEDPGDDQVLNRMLTVWIDDSLEQDRRVLEHMKEVEAAGVSGGRTTRRSSPPGRSGRSWGRRSCRFGFPFARRVQFAMAENRRNPGMLFDLIKCHARLFFLQRDRDDDGAVIANEEDFAAAARLYAALARTDGGQETKLTRNEAAALATVARMGVEVFTVRQLQAAMGLSYQKTRRILHGYTSRGTVYAGLLEKCPAISFFDASVIENTAEGNTIHRREQYFTFDLEVYQAWRGGTRSGWMMMTMLTAMTAGFSRVTATAVNEKTPVKAIIPKTPLNMRIFIPMITHMYSRMKERRARTRRLAVTTGVPLFPTLLSLKTGKSRIMSKIGKPRRFFAHSLTAPAVNVLKPAVTLHHRQTPATTSPSRWRRTNPVMSAAGGRHPP